MLQYDMGPSLTLASVAVLRDKLKVPKLQRLPGTLYKLPLSVGFDQGAWLKAKSCPPFFYRQRNMCEVRSPRVDLALGTCISLHPL